MYLLCGFTGLLPPLKFINFNAILNRLVFGLSNLLALVSGQFTIAFLGQLPTESPRKAVATLYLSRLPVIR